MTPSCGRSRTRHIRRSRVRQAVLDPRHEDHRRDRQPATAAAAPTAPPALTSILDDDGHGSGSTSVSVGNRYGYCPTCLLVHRRRASTQPPAPREPGSTSRRTAGARWRTSRSTCRPSSTRTLQGHAAAVERGQTILFAAGNGAANAFDAPDQRPMGRARPDRDWNVVVGAIRRDNQRAIVGDGTPAHLSSWGDGNLPSACRTGTVSQCAFGGTSAATPYTAGVFGNVLTEHPPQHRRQRRRTACRPGGRRGHAGRAQLLPLRRQAHSRRAARSRPQDGVPAESGQRAKHPDLPVSRSRPLIRATSTSSSRATAPRRRTARSARSTC